MKKRFTEQQIVAILKEGEAGVPAKDICRKHNISDATFYTWRKKYRGLIPRSSQTPWSVIPSSPARFSA